MAKQPPYRSAARLQQRWALGLCALLAGVSSAGCEWVLGGVPSPLDGPSLPGLDASQDDALPGSESARDAAVDAPDANREVDPGPVAPDASEPADAAQPAQPAEDAGPPPVPCDADAGATWYPDDDADGYGRDQRTIVGCPSDGRVWATRGGDCNDQNPAVFPGQARYFGEPYPLEGGGDSFDYDCSGSESGNGRQAVFLGCGIGELLVCVGQGYAQTERAGAFQNSVCGSQVYQTCSAAVLGSLACVGRAAVRPERYLCH